MSNQTNPPLSDFGNKCLETGEGTIKIHNIWKSAYDSEFNPDGLINLGIAENTLMHKELRDYFQRIFQLRSMDFSYSDGMTGTKRLSSALASFINSEFKPKKEVERDHILLGAGVTAILRQLAQTIANPGDGILITAPYYQGFDSDFKVGHELKPVAVSMPLSDVATMNEITHLERALEKSNKAGTPIKAIILCNPHNPLGRCYPVEVIEAYCRFAEKHNIHLISDEIYAKSIFPSSDYPNPELFVSVLSLDLEKLGVNPSRAHVLYGMSKDFNANGFRVGALISQHNPDLMTSLIVTAFFFCIASPSDALWSSLLNDAEFRDGFLQENRTRLQGAYEYATSWLKHHQVPYIASHAGHFLFIDFRPVLSTLQRYGSIVGMVESDSMEERELKLWQYFLSKKVMVLPGAFSHAPEAGWFRLTFAVRPDYVNMAFRRIEDALGWESWGQLKVEEAKSSCVVE